MSRTQVLIFVISKETAFFWKPVQHAANSPRAYFGNVNRAEALKVPAHLHSIVDIINGLRAFPSHESAPTGGPQHSPDRNAPVHKK
jgi:hypothetical protein